MLTELRLKHFKCFSDQTLALAPLTLLAGANGSGKSSVIQSLALLAQTFTHNEWSTGLLLNGPALALGGVADVLNQQTGRDALALGCSTGDERVDWYFKADNRQALTLHLAQVHFNGEPLPLGSSVRWLLPADQAMSSGVVKQLRQLDWITAERLGPREILPLRSMDDHGRVGPQGELAAGLLYWRMDDPVCSELCLPDVPRTLFHQVRVRMQAFFPGCDLRVAPISGANAVSLAFRMNSRSDFHRPQNVGFGLTQLFPVIVALLAARLEAADANVVLIENPEVHLHPGAQQRIGELAASAAACGVQVILETHSDHVLNGVRLAVKRGNIPPEKISLHAFGGEATPVSPQIDADGRLDVWPEGFFDQFDRALSALL